MRWMAVLCALTMMVACSKDKKKDKKANAAEAPAVEAPAAETPAVEAPAAKALSVLQQAGGLADKVCACADAACFQALENEGDALAAAMDKAIETATDADKQGFMAAMGRIAVCAQKLAAGAKNTAQKAGEAVKAAIPSAAAKGLEALEGAAPAIGKAIEAVNAAKAISGNDLGSDLKNAAKVVEVAAEATGAAAGLAEKAGVLNSDQAGKVQCQSKCSAEGATCVRSAGSDATAAVQCAQVAQACLANCK